MLPHEDNEKLILVYCPGRGSNSQPPAHRGVNMINVSYALTTRPRLGSCPNRGTQIRGYRCGKTFTAKPASTPPHHTVNEVKRRNLCMICALSHPPRQCPAFKDHCKYCDAIGHWEKCYRKKKSDSRQKPGGRRIFSPNELSSLVS